MMPCESWNAREAALLRMERASARTMAEEMAARWCGKKDWDLACGLPLRDPPPLSSACPRELNANAASAALRQLARAARGWKMRPAHRPPSCAQPIVGSYSQHMG